MTVATQSARKPSRCYLRRGHPITKGLIACWPFFVGAGQTLWDISGRQNHGTLNGPDWTTAEYGRVLSFNDANNDYIAVGNQELYDINQFTLVARLKLGETASGNRTITWVNGSDNNTAGFKLAQQGSNSTFELAFYNTSNTLVNTTGGTEETGVMKTLVGTYDQSNLVLYEDGVQVGSAASSDDVDYAVADDPTEIGRRPVDNDRYINADYDFVGIWNRALTATEARQLHEQPMLPFITKPR